MGISRRFPWINTWKSCKSAVAQTVEGGGSWVQRQTKGTSCWRVMTWRSMESPAQTMLTPRRDSSASRPHASLIVHPDEWYSLVRPPTVPVVQPIARRFETEKEDKLSPCEA